MNVADHRNQFLIARFGDAAFQQGLFKIFFNLVRIFCLVAEMRNFGIVNVRCRKFECCGLQNATNGKTLVHRLGCQRPRNPMRTLIFADEPALVEPAEDVTHHSSADTKIRPQLFLDDAEFTKNQA